VNDERAVGGESTEISERAEESGSTEGFERVVYAESTEIEERVATNESTVRRERAEPEESIVHHKRVGRNESIGRLEFISRLERNSGIFRDELRTEYEKFRHRSIQLPPHVMAAALSSRSLFYDFSALGSEATPFWINFLQLSISHSAVKDIHFTVSRSVVDGTQRAGGIQIFNEFDLAKAEGDPASAASGTSAEESQMPLTPSTVSSSMDSYAFERIMARIGAVEQRLGSVIEANNRKVAVIWITIASLVLLFGGTALTYLVYTKWL
jgi:hypothetical protein